MRKLMLIIFLFLMSMLCGCNSLPKNQNCNDSKLSLSEEQLFDTQDNTSLNENSSYVIELNNKNGNNQSFDNTIIDYILTLSYEEIIEFSLKYSNIMYSNYILIDYDDYFNFVIEMSRDFQKVENVKALSKVSPTKESVTKIEIGMDFKDIIEIIGLPIGSYTFGISSLDFVVTENCIIRIQLDEYMEVVSVKEIEVK